MFIDIDSKIQCITAPGTKYFPPPYELLQIKIKKPSFALVIKELEIFVEWENK